MALGSGALFRVMAPRYLLVLAAFACSKTPAEPTKPADQPQVAEQAPAAADAHDAFAKVDVNEAEKLVTAKQAVPVDANGAETRQEMGTLPGAVLLSNARTYEMGELPADKSTDLIFYCGGEKCMSAPKAAARAKEAGYTNVKVMSAGISGWVAAGKPVEKS